MNKIPICMAIFLYLGIVSAIPNSLHVNIQTTDNSGNIVTGTFNLIFNITLNSDCSGVVFSDSTTQTTDSRGIINYTIPNVNLDFNSTAFYFCYYRDSVLKSSDLLSSVPYAYYAQNTSWQGIIGKPTNLTDLGNESDPILRGDNNLTRSNQTEEIIENWTFVQSIEVGKGTVQSPLILYGRPSVVVVARRGGLIQWMYGGSSIVNPQTAGWTFVNSLNNLVFSPNKQSTTTDNGVAFINLQTGVANFSNVTAENFFGVINQWNGNATTNLNMTTFDILSSGKIADAGGVGVLDIPNRQLVNQYGRVIMRWDDATYGGGGLEYNDGSNSGESAYWGYSSGGFFAVNNLLKSDHIGELTASHGIVFDNPVSITKIQNLNTDGFVKTSSSDGTLIIDTTAYAENTSIWNEAKNKYNATYDLWAYNQTITETDPIFKADNNLTRKNQTETITSKWNFPAGLNASLINTTRIDSETGSWTAGSGGVDFLTFSKAWYGNYIFGGGATASTASSLNFMNTALGVYDFTSNSVRGIIIRQQSSDIVAPLLNFVKYRGNYGSTQAITSGDYAGAINFKVYSGNPSFITYTTAGMGAVTYGTVNATQAPTKYLFYTNKYGTNDPANDGSVRMELTDDNITFNSNIYAEKNVTIAGYNVLSFNNSNYIYSDSIGNMNFIANASNSTAVFKFWGNVTADDFATFSDVYSDSKSALSYINGADKLKNPDGSINHSAFGYSAIKVNVPDYSRPVEISGEQILTWEYREVSKDDAFEDVIVDVTIPKEITKYAYDENGNVYSYVNITEVPTGERTTIKRLKENVTFSEETGKFTEHYLVATPTAKTIYPYTIEKEGVSLVKENSLLRQAVYELSTKLNKICASPTMAGVCK